MSEFISCVLAVVVSIGMTVATSGSSSMHAGASPEEIQHLRSVLGRHLVPVIARDVSNFASRRSFAELVFAYTRDLPDCAHERDGTIYLGTKVVFGRQLGEGAFGTAFVTSGAGMGRVFKLSAKVIEYRKIDPHDTRRECEVMQLLSSRVMAGWVPNFPITFKTMHCKDNGTVTILSELADGDMTPLFPIPRATRSRTWTPAEYRSACLQVCLAMISLHSLEFIHGDLHPGNVLFHSVPPGGYWHYLVSGKDVFVENTGQLWVLCDFGESKPMSRRSRRRDRRLEEVQEDVSFMLYIIQRERLVPESVRLFAEAVKSANDTHEAMLRNMPLIAHVPVVSERKLNQDAYEIEIM
jgi:hypothetical protein